MNRRKYLKLLAGAGALTGLAGCSGLGTDDDESPATDTRDTTTPTETPATPSPTETATPEPDNPPTLATATATPQDNGEALAYQVVAEDDNGLQYVAVTYGDQTQEWEDRGRSIDETGQLTDLGQPPEEGQVAFIARDTAGQETREQRYPDQQAPTLSGLQLQPTANAGEIELGVQGEDNIGLKHLTLLLSDQPVHQQDVSGQSEASADMALNLSDRATLGEQHTLTARLEDWNGNTTHTDADTYVRRYDVMEDTRLDVGGLYFLFAGDKFGSVITEDEGEPTIGQYEDWNDIAQTDVGNRHVDQMQGHGVTRIVLNFGETDDDYKSFRNFEEASLFSEIEFEANWPLTQVLRRDRDIEEDLEFMRENFFNHENYVTHEERPVIDVWSPAWLSWAGNEESSDARDYIVAEYGGLPDFVDYMRDELTVDETEPFIIGYASKRGVQGFEEVDFWNRFDGLTNWVGELVPNRTISNEEHLEYMEENYRGIAEFAGDDQVFWPMVIPGFNDRPNEEWGRDRQIPRSTEYFRKMLELAEEYGDGRMNIYSFNEWTEGTQIEPGRFRGEDYGTDYLEVVEQFQQEGS